VGSNLWLGQPYVQADTLGVGTAAAFINITSLAVDADGTVLISDHYKMKVANSSANVSLAFGTGTPPQSGVARDGCGGSASSSAYEIAMSKTVGGTGYYISSGPNGTVIRKITGGNYCTSTYVGDTRSISGGGDAAQFDKGYSLGNGTTLAVDSSNTIYWSDRLSGGIYKMNTSGTITYITSVVGVVSGFSAGPKALEVDSSGNIFVFDEASKSIKKVTQSGVVTNFITLGFDIGDMAMDSSGNIYLVDTSTNNIKKITSTGVMTNIGTLPVGGSSNAIAVAPDGTIYTQHGLTVYKVTF
jgi:streptogramin lyase